MAERTVFRPPPEPAHVSVVRQYEDLVAILRYIRDKGQEVIDQGFDRVASQIGFVVATTLPVTAEVNGQGEIERLSVRGTHLEGTLFDTELLASLKKVLGDNPKPSVKGSSVSQGTYYFYLLWFDALKLKLNSIIYHPYEMVPWPLAELARFRPPPEPAHLPLLEAMARFRPPPEPAHCRPEELARFRPPPEPAHAFLGRRPPPEPAHWFDPRIPICEGEQVVIVALDEVYPELRLVERINSYRQAAINPQPLPP
jgi:hypothetical protein